MSGTLRDAIKIGAVVIAVLIIVVLAFQKITSSTETINKASAQNDKDMTTMQESRYTQFDGEVITGSQVLSTINSLAKDKISIVVYNGAGTTANAASESFAGTAVTYIYSTSGTDLSAPVADMPVLLRNAKDSTNAAYINPSSNFYGIVKRSDNTGTISQIIFQRVTD